MAPAKARVGVRLKEAIGGSKSQNRSADLDALVERFNVLKAKLKSLIISLKNHHAAMQEIAKTRSEVANCIGMIAEKTPLHDCAGKLPQDGDTSVVSFRSVHLDYAKRSGAYSDKYNQYIVEYAIEWDKVVTNRISAGIKNAEQLRRDLDHYQGKVESLRQSTNKTLANGKQVDAKTSEKLARNEEKLVKAKEHYNRFATDMCILIEEVTDRAWKDLHPMLVKLAQFDSTMSSDESKAMSALNQVVAQLKALADKHGLTPQARLKDLAERKPSEITTGKSTGGALALESGGAFGGGGFMGGTAGVTSPVYGDGPSLAPGTVSPQGIGGLPVQLASSDSNALSRASSMSSFNSGVNSATGSYNNYSMTTSDMLAVAGASAPPPSMEQVQDATGSMSFGESPARRASSNSLPPLGPNSYGRSLSMASTDSASMGGPPAPAPAAPPPPPPSAPGLSMYSSYGSNVPMAPAVPLDPPSFATGAYGDPPSAHPWSAGGAPPSNAAGGRSSNPFDD